MCRFQLNYPKNLYLLKTTTTTTDCYSAYQIPENAVGLRKRKGRSELQG